MNPDYDAYAAIGFIGAWTASIYNWMSDDLKKNTELVELIVCRGFAEVLDKVSNDIRTNYEFLKKLTRCNSEVLKYIPNDEHDFDTVLAVVTKDGHALELTTDD